MPRIVGAQDELGARVSPCPRSWHTVVLTVAPPLGVFWISSDHHGSGRREHRGNAAAAENRAGRGSANLPRGRAHVSGLGSDLAGTDGFWIPDRPVRTADPRDRGCGSDAGTFPSADDFTLARVHHDLFRGGRLPGLRVALPRVHPRAGSRHGQPVREYENPPGHSRDPDARRPGDGGSHTHTVIRSPWTYGIRDAGRA